MAERVADKCEKRLGRKPAPAPTADTPLPGGDFTETIDELRSRIESLGLGPTEAGRAARLYGSEALEIFAKEDPFQAEARHAVEQEGALTLEDYWVRRSARARFEVGGDGALLALSAEHMSELMDWSDDERERQIGHCKSLRAGELKAAQSAPTGDIQA
jgi:glycerol-3-phosphate dehydrogenase